MYLSGDDEMGLDTDYDCWHGPYSAFNRFRHALAAKIGIDLDSMEGFQRDPARGATRWDLLKPDPLLTLLNHSDCDGWIEADDCAPLAARLREVAALFDPGEGGVEAARRADLSKHPGMTAEQLGHTPVSKEPSLMQRAIYDGVAEACLRFAKGLEAADKDGARVEFH
jgi:hypothetical protein